MAYTRTTPSAALSEAGTLFAGLIAGLPSLPSFPEPPNVDVPDIGTLPVDLTAVVEPTEIGDLTDGAVAGTGIFDKIMTSLNAHIVSQYNNGILAKSEVAAVYVAAIETALPQAVKIGRAHV